MVLGLGAASPVDRVRWPQWISSGLSVAKLSEIMRLADEGYYGYFGELGQEILTRDPRISGFAGVRLASLVRRPVRCVPNEADPDPGRAAEVAAYGQQVLGALRSARHEPEAPGETRIVEEKGLRGVVRTAAKAIFYGVQAGWKYWETLPGEPTPQPTALEFFDERRFYIGQYEELRIETKTSGPTGTPLSAWPKALTFEVRNTRLTHRLARSGVLFATLLPWWLSFEATKYLSAYAGRFAVPGIFGQLPAISEISSGLTQSSWAKLRQIFRSYESDISGLLPPGVMPLVVEPSGSGVKLFEFIDRQTVDWLQFAYLGQTGTSSGGGGSYAKAVVNDETKDDVTEDDAALIADWLQEDILAYPIALRFGSGTPPCRVEFEPTDTTRLKKIQYLTEASKAGAPVTLTYLSQTAGIPLPGEEEDGAALLGGLVWDAKRKRPVTPEVWISERTNGEGDDLTLVSARKEQALTIQAAAYPLNAMLAAGVAVDVAAYAERFGIPLDPTKPPYTKPEDGAPETPEGSADRPPAFLEGTNANPS